MSNWDKELKEGWNKPRRHLLCRFVDLFDWFSLYELQFGNAANLTTIIAFNKGRQVGGCDTRQECIDHVTKNFKGGHFRKERGDDLLLSDKSADLILADGVLMKEKNVDKFLKEMKRVARRGVVLVEPHSDNLFKRIVYRLKTGYNMRNWSKLLKKHGYYDIELYTIPAEVRSIPPWDKDGRIIIARVLSK